MAEYAALLTPSVASRLLALPDDERGALIECLRVELASSDRPKMTVSRAGFEYSATPLSNGWTAVSRTLTRQQLQELGGSGTGASAGFLLVDLVEAPS